MPNLLKKLLENGILVVLLLAIILSTLFISLSTWLADLVLHGISYNIKNMLPENMFTSEELNTISDAILLIKQYDIGAFFIGFVLFFLSACFILITYNHLFLWLIKSKKFEAIKINEAFDILELKTHIEQLIWLKATPLKVYIATSDLEEYNDKQVNAKWYPFMKMPFNRLTYFKTCLAENRICLDKQAFEIYYAKTIGKYSHSLEKHVQNDKEELVELREKHSQLEQEITELRKFKQTSSARETNIENTAIKGFYIGKMCEDFTSKLRFKGVTGQYGEEEIRKELLQFISENKELSDIFMSTKSRKSKIELTENNIVTLNVIEEIKKELGEYARKQGRPSQKKEKEVLKNL